MKIESMNDKHFPNNPPPVPAMCEECEKMFLAEQERAQATGPLRAFFCDHALTGAAAIRSGSGIWLWFLVGPLSKPAALDVLGSIAAGFQQEDAACQPTAH